MCRLSLGHVADGGSLAEEVISTVRTAHAFGTQKILASLYEVSVKNAFEVDSKASVWHGGGLACLFFIVYCSYALGQCLPASAFTCAEVHIYLAFSFGTTLINEGHATPGQVVNVLMAILTGSFSLAMMAPEMQGLPSPIC